MSIAVYKVLNRNVPRAVKLATHNIVRMLASTDEPCHGKQGEPPKPKDPCPPKADPSPAPPPPTSSCQKPPPSSSCQKPPPPPPPPASASSKPPPCPSMPQCPPTICPPSADSGNPCNYCPPPCPEPGAPNLTKLKKWQCFFQEDNDIPLFLKRGNLDAFLFQANCVLLIIVWAAGLYGAYTLKLK